MKLRFPSPKNPLWLTGVFALVFTAILVPAHATGILACALLVIGLKAFLGLGVILDEAIDFDDTCGQHERPYQPDLVDPWLYQQRLMEISEQAMPSTPYMTNDVLLYWALIMEEASELTDAVMVALRRYYMRSVEGMPAEGPIWVTHALQEMRRASAQASASSQHIRHRLGRVNVNFSLTPAEAAEILDGTTDLVVVNAGFSLAAGLPGAAAYTEVASSNLSKADPTTGMIAKDAGGKWIKGSNYIRPDLERVLAEQQ